MELLLGFAVKIEDCAGSGVDIMLRSGVEAAWLGFLLVVARERV